MISPVWCSIGRTTMQRAVYELDAAALHTHRGVLGRRCNHSCWPHERSDRGDHPLERRRCWHQRDRQVEDLRLALAGTVHEGALPWEYAIEVTNEGKVWHPGELYPRVGFIVTNMSVVLGVESRNALGIA
jgi:hypothetical protein